MWWRDRGFALRTCDILHHAAWIDWSQPLSINRGNTTRTCNHCEGTEKCLQCIYSLYKVCVFKPTFVCELLLFPASRSQSCQMKITSRSMVISLRNPLDFKDILEQKNRSFTNVKGLYVCWKNYIPTDTDAQFRKACISKRQQVLSICILSSLCVSIFWVGPHAALYKLLKLYAYLPYVISVHIRTSSHACPSYQRMVSRPVDMSERLG